MSDLFGRGLYSDEALWRARFDSAVAEAMFWRNFAFLRPFGVLRSVTDTVIRLPLPPPPKPPAAFIPHPRTEHPAVAELTERALRNSNRGGRA